ncbi:MAG: oligosaccharide flippase family protein, partial [Gammaproteobacteria bacterium]|nr:oligosaccharide flippase family protein [Gammaproteobacteria bacterium]
GIERMKYLAVINFVTVFIFVIGTIIIVHSPDEVIEASFIRSFSFLAGSIAGLVILALNTDIRFRPVIDFNHWFELARKTYIFLFNRLATNLGQFAPFYAVTILYADEIVGLFAASHRLYIIALTALFAVTSAVYPILSDLARNKPEQLVEYQQKLIQFLAFLFIPTGLFCMVFSDDIMRFLFGDKYIDASFSAGLLLLALPVVAIKTIYVFSLLGSRMETRALQVNVVGVVLQLFLAILLVPSYNLTGAASMMLIGEFMAMCLAYYYCLTLLGSMRLIDSVVVRICVISFVVVLIAYALNIKLIWTALLSATLYLVLSPVVGIVPQSFLRKLKS